MKRSRFINQSLDYEWGFLLNDMAVVKKNGHRAYVNSSEVDFPASPYLIDIEDHGFWYENESERDLDYKKILLILAANKIQFTHKK